MKTIRKRRKNLELEKDKKQLGVLLSHTLHHRLKVIAALKKESLSETIERYLLLSVPTLEAVLTSSPLLEIAHSESK